MIVSSNQDVLAGWLCDRIGLVPSPHMKCLGVVSADGQHLRGVIGYDGYNGASVQMHVAGEPQWIGKDILFAAFDYPFNVMGCNVVIGLVPSGNQAALILNRKLGFETLLRIPDAHPDGALVLMQMRRENCKWLAPRRVH